MVRPSRPTLEPRTRSSGFSPSPKERNCPSQNVAVGLIGEPVAPGTAARPARPRRRRPYDRVLPILFVWILVSAAAGAPALAAALSVVFISMLACRIAYGGRW